MLKLAGYVGTGDSRLTAQTYPVPVTIKLYFQLLLLPIELLNLQAIAILTTE